MSIALPVYTHLFDLFGHLTAENIENHAMVECEKNHVIAVVYPGGRCLRRAYGLAVGQPPNKSHETVLEFLYQDLLEQSECDCLIASAEEYHDEETLSATNLSIGGKRFLVEKWLCIKDDSYCNM